MQGFFRQLEGKAGEADGVHQANVRVHRLLQSHIEGRHLGQQILAQHLIPDGQGHALLPPGSLQIPSLASGAHIRKGLSAGQLVGPHPQVEYHILLRHIVIDGAIYLDLHPAQGIDHLLEALKLEAQIVLDRHPHAGFQNGRQQRRTASARFVRLAQIVHHIDLVGLMARDLVNIEIPGQRDHPGLPRLKIQGKDHDHIRAPVDLVGPPVAAQKQDVGRVQKRAGRRRCGRHRDQAGCGGWGFEESRGSFRAGQSRRQRRFRGQGQGGGGHIRWRHSPNRLGILRLRPTAAQNQQAKQQPQQQPAGRTGQNRFGGSKPCHDNRSPGRVVPQTRPMCGSGQ